MLKLPFSSGWDVPRSKAWAMISPLQTFDSAGMDTAAKASPFSYTWSYRHLLNIRSDSTEGDDDEGEGMQKFGSVVEKEWSSFMHTGFAAPDANKLRFDLTGEVHAFHAIRTFACRQVAANRVCLCDRERAAEQAKAP